MFHDVRGFPILPCMKARLAARTFGKGLWARLSRPQPLTLQNVEDTKVPSEGMMFCSYAQGIMEH
ncbi:hypothetical protein KSB_60260 [Ktedonobacter robiniae]|uniref:Uncharacterized protein n=1 Tax=Ktedonobacter robiniae TaxID=2778365 RepID=A0ABQ3UXI0_9CHLR|nr:hypothetical protein KSB_60260 [Ktedonobacter robiniae]